MRPNRNKNINWPVLVDLNSGVAIDCCRSHREWCGDVRRPCREPLPPLFHQPTPRSEVNTSPFEPIRDLHFCTVPRVRSPTTRITLYARTMQDDLDGIVRHRRRSLSFLQIVTLTMAGLVAFDPAQVLAGHPTTDSELQTAGSPRPPGLEHCVDQEERRVARRYVP